ncbi:MAG: pyridoxal-dependent decarboxylase, partial [Acidobacteria bacterium]|nr:pyridoxal-dependent decarboxylase [Acidobacteriota bacterium]
MNFRRLLDAAADRIAAFRDGIREARVTPTVAVAEVRAHLEEHYGDFTEPWPEEALVENVSSMLENWNVQVAHPRYFGLFNPPTHPAAVAADLLVAGFNPQLAAWSHAPAANEIERHTLRYLAARLGFDPEHVAATFTTGGAEANQSAVLVALNDAFPEYIETGLTGVAGAGGTPVIYVSSESHHSIEKAAMTSGLGRRAVRTVAIDESFRMSLPALREAIRGDRRRGLRPRMGGGTAGPTGGGNIDPHED